MSMKTSSEKIRQVIMTIMIVAAVLAVLFGKQFAMTVMASAGKVTSTTANVRSQPSSCCRQEQGQAHLVKDHRC